MFQFSTTTQSCVNEIIIIIIIITLIVCLLFCINVFSSRAIM
jgi:hypothetical protein